MTEEIIVKHCAPVLAGLKTANLINCKADKNFSDNGSIEKLAKKGVETVILAENGESSLVYVFRRTRLENDLNKPETISLLREFGYEYTSVDEAVGRLKERIAVSPCFPHEIGLFLGYPVEDVKGFIENKGRNYKCMGYWKVYCNECEAKKTFEKYKKCIDVYTRVYLEGAGIDKLTVAV